jgi:tRNA U55 pseudouridine synthase TruB
VLVTLSVHLVIRVCLSGYQGQALGTCAHLTALRREAIGDYSVDDAFALPALLELISSEAPGASSHFQRQPRQDVARTAADACGTE